jgi:hypothetical protein
MSAVAKVVPMKKVLSQSPSAVASRNRRANLKKEQKAMEVQEQKAAAVKEQKQTVNQFCAGIAAGFLPVASFVIAHYESATQPMLWILVAAALLFSAPTLASWAQKWCGSQYKAWGFTILLEGVMVFSHIQALMFAGLTILVLINATNAWALAKKNAQ